MSNSNHVNIFLSKENILSTALYSFVQCICILFFFNLFKRLKNKYLRKQVLIILIEHLLENINTNGKSFLMDQLFSCVHYLKNSPVSICI